MFLVETIAEYIAMIPPGQRTIMPFRVGRGREEERAAKSARPDARRAAAKA